MSTVRVDKKWRWSAHRDRYYRRSIDRNFGDYWKGEIGYGTVPVAGRLLPASKLRTRKTR